MISVSSRNLFSYYFSLPSQVSAFSSYPSKVSCPQHSAPSCNFGNVAGNRHWSFNSIFKNRDAISPKYSCSDRRFYLCCSIKFTKLRRQAQDALPAVPWLISSRISKEGLNRSYHYEALVPPVAEGFRSLHGSLQQIRFPYMMVSYISEADSKSKSSLEDLGF